MSPRFLRLAYQGLVFGLLVIVIGSCLFADISPINLALKGIFAQRAVKRNEYPASTLEYEGVHSYNTSFDLHSSYYLTNDSKTEVIAFYESRDEIDHLIDGDALEWEAFTSLDEFISNDGYRIRNTTRVMQAHEAQCANISFECFSALVLTMPDGSILIVISYWVFGL